MLKQLEVKLVDYYHGFDEYYIFYDDRYMTEEQAEKELEFLDWGMGFDAKLYPYYLILPKVKKPILSCIGDYLKEIGYNMASGKFSEEDCDGD